MKKVLLLAVIAVAFTFKSNAQKNVVKANPLGLLFGVASVGYERAVSDKGAVEISAAYSSAKVVFDSNEEITASGFGAEGKYKFYFSAERLAPRGWYFAPTITYANASAESDSESGEVTIFGGGAVAGYQWVFGGGTSGFALDLNFGAQYISANVSGDIDSADIDGILPRVGLAIGYSW